MIRMCSTLLLLASFGWTVVYGQIDSSSVATKEEVTTVKESVDGLNETVSAMKTTLEAMLK